MFNPLALVAVTAALVAAPVAPKAPVAPIAPKAPVAPVASFEWAMSKDQQVIPNTLNWQVRPAGAKAAPGSVEFDLGFRSPNHSWTMGADVPLATLDGLTAAQLAAAGQAVSFVLHHDAGDFRCHGEAGEAQGVGTCVYAANTGFGPALAKRGIGQPETYQQFQLALSDIGLDYVDELKREKYATPTVEDLVRAGTHGAGMRQLKAMDAAGYHFGDVATLVKMRDHGVSATYIEALKGFGYTGLPAEGLLRMRDHGVSATYIGELRSHGYAKLEPEEMVRMRDHGVSSTYVADLQTIGYANMAPADLVRLRDQGVSAAFISGANTGGKKLGVDELIKLRHHGYVD